MLVFALIFGASGGRGVAHAREVPFITQPSITTSANGARSVYAADLDGDGDLDGLSASFNDDKIAWYENVGGGGASWVLHTISTTADGAYSVYAADSDGDGDLDVLSASQNDDEITWYENVGGSGTSWVQHSISSTANAARSVYAVDVDGDGDHDVVSGSRDDDKIAWYENVGGAGTSWVLHTISTTANGAQSVDAADLDGDGDIDVLSASLYDNKIAWYENEDGGTSWTLHTLSTTTGQPRSVYAADVDGDGDFDALATASSGNRTVWFENMGGTSWTLHTIGTIFFPVSAYAADVDQDGDLDAIVATDDGLFRYENAGGSGTSWSKHTISSTADQPNWVFAADVDGDGDIDGLSASLGDDTIAWYRNETIHRGATFATATPVSTTALGAEAVMTGDIDGDGDLDAVSASFYDNKIAWYENIGDGTTWVLRTISTSASAAFSVDLADVDGDGDLDVLSASLGDHKVAWYENVSGGASWVLHTITTAATGARSVFAADVDSDGDMDAVAAARDADTIAWYENISGGGTSWTAHTISTAADFPLAVFAADLDGDGDLDVLSASKHDSTVAWYENVGGGGSSWATHVIDASALGARSVFASDVDGDGDLDVLAASDSDDRIAWYENDAADGTTWTLHTIAINADYAFSVFARDLDGDGDIDVLSASSGDDKVVWYENDGGGTSWVVHTVTTGADGATWVNAADLDGDGDLDVLSTSSNDNAVRWYENVGGQFALATVDTAPASIFASAADDVLRITMTHRGRNYGDGLDHDAELATLDLGFDDGTGAPMSTPLSSGEANALVEELRVYHDDGNSVFDGGDTLVTTVETLALTSGRQTVTFTDGDPNVLVGPEASETFFVVLAATVDADSQTPDALRVTHVTSSSSTAEDRDHDIPLTLEEVADETSDLVTFEAAANLAVTKSDGVTMVDPGDPLTYTIVASNAGPSNAPGSTVTDTFPATLTGCTWTCIGSNGGTCTAAGSADIADTVNLPVGGNVTYTVDCTVAETATNLVVNTATVAAPGGVTDPDPGNNVATDVDTLQGIFADGFETGDTSRWDDEEPDT